MSKIKQKNNFLIDLLQFQSSSNGQSELLNNIRLNGTEEVRSKTLPGSKDEDWRFISLRELYRDSYILASNLEVNIPDFEEYYIPESRGARMVFINGQYSREHSSFEELPDEVIIGNMEQIAETHPSIIEEHLDKYADYGDDIFTSFNKAFLNHGSVIYVPKGLKLETPIQLLHVHTDAEEVYFTTSRGLIIAGEGSEVTLVEDHVGLGDNKYFNLPVFEVSLERNAYVKHTKIQRDSDESIHIARTAAHVRQHANYESYTITIGAKLSRNEPRITQLEEEVEFTVDGLVLINGDQVSDTHSVMDHKFSHCDSHQLHKCVLHGKAHSVFNGKIFVQKNAQKIDSFQENRNLMLSRKALVNTKPQLEIFADDVVCTHGATVGQLEEDEVFYLKSRGLSEKQATELLTYAFALETIENITVDSVQQLLVDEVYKFTNRQLDSELVA